MNENLIKVKDIGIIKNFTTQTVTLRYNPLAHTLKAQRISQIQTKYPDGSEKMIQTKTFLKRIDEAPYYLNRKIFPIDHYMEMWHLAKQAGFSVAPTVKINDHELSIMDISEGGYFLIKQWLEKLTQTINVVLKLPEEN